MNQGTNQYNDAALAPGGRVGPLESGAEATALQTLCAIGGGGCDAKRLECGRFSAAFSLRVWLAVLAGALALLFTPLAARAADAAAPLEYKVKAGYLFNFAKFVEWPASAFPAADSPFVIAVLDDGEAQSVIEQVLGGRNINGHPVLVKTVSATNLPKDAHILLVPRTAGQTPDELRETLGLAPTLLVGETEQFAERGGAFAFVRKDESVRLTLCLEHAGELGLKVSAKLASVAKSVKSQRKK